MIRTVNNQSGRFIVDEDIVVFEEDPSWVEFLASNPPVLRTTPLDRGALLPCFQNILRQIDIQYISFPQTCALGEFLAVHGDFLSPQGFINLAQFRSWKYFPQIAIHALTDIV